jgi:hypothetical protein
MDIPMDHLKKAKVSMSDAKMVEDTKILDGEAKDSPVFNENNATEQYTTPALSKGELGGRNDPNG